MKRSLCCASLIITSDSKITGSTSTLFCQLVCTLRCGAECVTGVVTLLQKLSGSASRRAPGASRMPETRAVAPQVVDSETGLAKNDSVRTSSGFFYELGEDEARTWHCVDHS